MTAKPKMPDETSPGIDLLAWNLRKYRVAAGISQVQLGTAAGVDRTYVGRLERAAENPSLAVIDKLAAALNIHVLSLLRIPDPSEAPPKPMTAGRKAGHVRQKPDQ